MFKTGTDCREQAGRRDPGPAARGIEGYQAPGWHDASKRTHLDLTVTDLESAAKELPAIGAAKPEFQPGEGKWVALTDPEAHPSCLTTSA
jgi:hypothetical protein